MARNLVINGTPKFAVESKPDREFSTPMTLCKLFFFGERENERAEAD